MNTNEDQNPNQTPQPKAPQAPGHPQIQGGQIKNHMGLAIFSFFFSWPFGLAAIIFASKVNRALASGDIAGAEEASKSAKKWALIGIFVISALVIIGILSSAPLYSTTTAGMVYLFFYILFFVAIVWSYGNILQVALGISKWSALWFMVPIVGIVMIIRWGIKASKINKRTGRASA